jgi:hypothetical protein
VRFLISLSLSLIFFTWLLPLGVFIKPAQEKMACGGQRAICLCHQTISKTTHQPMEQGASFRGAGSSPKQEASSSGGANHSYLAVLLRQVVTTQLAAVVEQQYLSYKNPYLATLEHVPKV